MRISIAPSKIEGFVTAPPSKSAAHRALICAALADGRSVLQNIVFSQDILATQQALAQLGTRFTVQGSQVTVQGIRRLCVPECPIDCNESGSTLRFLIPLCSLTGAKVCFTGQGRLFARPQEVYAQMFEKQGLSFVQTAQGITIEGALSAGKYTVRGDVSSQFISGLLFALAWLEQESSITITPPFESRSYVALTCQAMQDFGVQTTWRNENTICINAKEKYKPNNVTVESDYSQAAFFAVLGAIKGGVTIQNLRADSLQGDKVILEILKRCNAEMTQTEQGIYFAKSKLQATEIDLADCPDLGPILMVLGLFCEGETIIKNAARLRMKESDRIAAMQTEIAKMGGEIKAQADTVRITPAKLNATAHLQSHNDHRIAMALSVAALGADVPVCIDGAQAVRKSYPDFWQVIKTLGAEVSDAAT